MPRQRSPTAFVNDFKCVEQFKICSNTITDVAVPSKTGKLVAAAANEQIIYFRFLDPRDGKEDQPRSTGTKTRLLALSPNGGYVVVADDRISVMNIHDFHAVNSGKIRRNLETPEVHNDDITRIKWSADCTSTFYTSSIDTTIRVWNYKTVHNNCLVPKKILHATDQNGLSWKLNSFDVDSKDKCVVGGGSEGYMFIFMLTETHHEYPLIDHIDPSKSIKIGHNDSIKEVALTRSGETCYAGTTSGLVKVLIQTGHIEKKFIHERGYERCVLIRGETVIGAISVEGVVLFNTDLKPLKTITVASGIPTTLGWNEDVDWMYVGTTKGTIVIFKSNL